MPAMLALPALPAKGGEGGISFPLKRRKELRWEAPFNLSMLQRGRYGCEHDHVSGLSRSLSVHSSQLAVHESLGAGNASNASIASKKGGGGVFLFPSNAERSFDGKLLSSFKYGTVVAGWLCRRSQDQLLAGQPREGPVNPGRLSGSYRANRGSHPRSVRRGGRGTGGTLYSN